MRLSRIHTDQPLSEGEALTLPQAQSHYVGRVLRLMPGDPLLLFNGDGHEYAARIQEAGRKQAVVSVEARQAPVVESPLPIHLGLCISRGERMDWAVQKSTELGVSVLAPLFSERCEVRLRGERSEKRLAHWRQVAISACEQCGRVRLPEVHPPASLADWLEKARAPVRLICDQRQEAGLPDSRPEGGVDLLVGPEGGFTDAEIELARRHGFRGLALGPRVLRTETAPVAALAVLQYLWGDLKAG